MAVNYVRSPTPSTKSYPKLMSDGQGNIYMAYSRTKGCCIALSNNGSNLLEGHFYGVANVDFSLAMYKDYEGSVTLSNV